MTFSLFNISQIFGWCLIFMLSGCNRTDQGGGTHSSKEVSYALAVKTTGTWIQDHPSAATQTLLRGMTDVADGTTPMISFDSAQLVRGSGESGEGDSSPFNDWMEKRGYAEGFLSAEAWKTMGVSLSSKDLQRGFQDVINNTSKLTLDQANALLVQADREVMDRVTQNRKKNAEKNLRDGKKFLAENASQSGVLSLPSGLQYKVIASGGGNHPGPEDYVEVILHGTNLDGTPIDEFDKDPLKSCTLCVSSVIPGWQEILQLMTPGDKWQVFIPSNLAYAGEGALNVEPNSVVIYTMELKSILPGRPVLTTEQIKEQNSQ
jgi:FKBP-type peptidyl-prolyl cis-trans isomerase